MQLRKAYSQIQIRVAESRVAGPAQQIAQELGFRLTESEARPNQDLPRNSWDVWHEQEHLGVLTYRNMLWSLNDGNVEGHDLKKVLGEIWDYWSPEDSDLEV